jgi:hypothetical protein
VKTLAEAEQEMDEYLARGIEHETDEYMPSDGCFGPEVDPIISVSSSTDEAASASRCQGGAGSESRLQGGAASKSDAMDIVKDRRVSGGGLGEGC